MFGVDLQETRVWISNKQLFKSQATPKYVTHSLLKRLFLHADLGKSCIFQKRHGLHRDAITGETEK